MKWSSLVKYCLWVMLVLVLLQLQRSSTCLGCMEEERIALLEFKKASCNWNDMCSDGNDHFLPSWVDERGSECCSWERVHCNSTTGRVIQLSLSDVRGIIDFDDIYFVGVEHSNWYLNVTLFSSLKELQHLNLSYNGFEGWINNKGFEKLAGLRKLKVLDLSYNYFNISILQSLGELKSLTTLSLQYNNIEGSIHLEEFLSNLPNLKSLNLYYNYIKASSQTKQGSIGLVGLAKLEALDLSLNNFDNHILPVLGTLTSLRTLSLGGNSLEGLLPLQELANLHDLESLDLSWNNFNCSSQVMEELANLHDLQSLDLSWNKFNCSSQVIQEFISTLPNLKSLDLSYCFLNASSQTNQVGSTRLAGSEKLEVLNLEGNFFDNHILPFLGKLTSLKTLFLGYNSLEGPLTMGELANLHNLLSLDLSWNNISCSSQAIQALCGMKKLQELYLRGNNFEGILPPCLQNLTSLGILDLSYNQFKGNIPSSLITSLPSLSHIRLGNNDFEGTFTFRTFANYSKLKEIDFGSAGNKLEIEFEHSPWVPLFQLKKLSLSSCNLSNRTGVITRFLSSQYNLRELDLSHCNLNGILILACLLENNKMLSVLNLRNNSMRGHFVLPSYVHNAARDLDISENHIDGLIQENIGNIFPYLRSLNLSKNNFQDGIPSSIGFMSSLVLLDLSDNNFTGEIPKRLAEGCSDLIILALSNNRLQGDVFPPHFNLTSLNVLLLDNNSFSGNILTGLSKCNKLEILDINNNHLIGRIPCWIGNLAFLVVLKMGGNVLQGNIPIEFQRLRQLRFLDLSQNHLSGSMVSLLNSTNLMHLHLEGNGFIGSPSTAFINNPNLRTLDIRNNNLYGGIPDWMGVLLGLRVLLLKENHLNGPIPHHLCQLESINLIDLSRNSLSGSIPQCFKNISFGRRTYMDSISETYDGWIGIASSEIWIRTIDEIEFVTKSRSSSYRGDILNFMSGIDLSFNDLTGDIPNEIGDLNGIYALNLSHNHLSGSIPKTFSNLKKIESLDLSYNKLTGEIPSELITLYTLEVFTVAHNNLSGKTPEMKGQFATFDNTNYEGNPFLCGPPLSKAYSCSTSGESTNSSATATNDADNKYDIDINVFVGSFVASYVMCLLGLTAILYINPYWRRRWFHFIGECIYSCHDFLFDTYYKLCIYVHRFRLFLCKTLIE